MPNNRRHCISLSDILSDNPHIRITVDTPNDEMARGLITHMGYAGSSGSVYPFLDMLRIDPNVESPPLTVL